MVRSFDRSGFAVADVTVVDTTDGTLQRNMTVAIDGGRIASIKAGGSSDDRSERVIDGRGRYVIPGYFDMHAHVLDASAPQAYRDVMLANGIVGFRQMSGTTQLLEKRRDESVRTVDGPRLLAMPGEILTAQNAASPEAAVNEVRRQHAAGADFIKVLDVPRSAFFAALGEARRLGLPFVGHLPASVDALEASNAGMRSIEHLGPRDGILAGCTCAGHAAAAPQQNGHGQQTPPLPPGSDPAAFFARMIANPLLFTNPAEFERYRKVTQAYSDVACIDLAKAFIENETWQVPTLIRLRTMAYADDDRYRDDPDLRFVPAATQALWSELGQQFALRLSDDMKRAIQNLYALQERLVEQFGRAGVPMLAGSDLGGQWVLPGSSLHQEFDLLARAEVSPLAVLQMTTLNGARFLGIDGDFGSVADGKYADLVFLEENPVESVQALHTVSGVLYDGRYYDKEELDAMKDATALTLRSAG